MDPSPSTMPNDRETLTDILRRRTLFIVDPIVTVMARWRISPNSLTIVGMLALFLVAWLIAQGVMQWAAVAIFFIAPLDALDGALARKLGMQQGNFGAFLDSTLDRLAEIILFGGFIFYYVGQDNSWLLAATYVAVTGSLMVSYTRARAEALGHSARVGVLSRVERYVVLTLALLIDMPQIAVVVIAAFTYLTVVQRVVHVWQQARVS